MSISPKLYTFLCACFAALGASVFGYDLAVISYVLAAPDFEKTTIAKKLADGTTDNPKYADYTGFMVSSLLLGAFVGSVPASYCADKFGRRVAITVAASIFIIGAIIQTATMTKEMMMAGRFFAGLGIGQMGVLTPLYQSEIAHPSNRGRLTATFQFFLGIGAFVAAWIGYGCQQGAMGTALQWRLPLGFQALPAVPLVLLTFLLPESPRWLAMKGRHDEALQTLARLHSRGNIHDSVVIGEYANIKAVLEEAGALDQSWGVIFRDWVNFRKVMYGVILQFSVQMTGVSAIQYYANDVYTSVGFAKDALLINSINSVTGLIGQVLCVVFLDRVGRRTPLIFGNIGSGLCFIVATAMAKQFATGGGTKAQGVVFVVMIYLYNLIFSSCIGPLSWVYPVEIMQNSIRAKAVGITTSASWLANFTIGQVTPKAFENIGWKYYLVFTVCCFSNALVFYLFFHETRGRTLEEMDHLLRNANFIVPLAKIDKIDAAYREREFARDYEGVKPASQEPVAQDEKEDYGRVEHMA